MLVSSQSYISRLEKKILVKLKKDIETLVGHNVKILNGNGEWEEVSFHSYGKQPLMKVTLSSNGKEKIIYATPEHEWIVNGLNTKVITAQLPLNKYLAKITPKLQDIVPDPVGIIHGFTYGDGSLSSHTKKGGYSHRVIFYNESEKELKQYFKISGLKYAETSTLCDNGVTYESIQFHAAENMKKVLTDKKAKVLEEKYLKKVNVQFV